MCNAYNHATGCECGFGGETYYPKHTVGDEIQFLHFGYDSFVNPRSKCPVCREPVFFYRSPNGGGVYFDALGHPWPKQPCTESSVSLPMRPTLDHILSDRKAWVRQGWSAIILNSLRISEFPRRIVGFVQRESGAQKWEAFHTHHENFSWILHWHDYPIFIKRQEELSYRFITITIKEGLVNEVEFLAERKS